MAVSVKGQVILSDEGVQYPLKFTHNALADHEDQHGVMVLEDAQLAVGAHLTFSRMRRLLRSAIQGGGGDVTLRQAGDIIDRVGAEPVGALVGQAIKAAFPHLDQDDAAGDAATPGGDAPAKKGKAAKV